MYGFSIPTIYADPTKFNINIVGLTKTAPVNASQIFNSSNDQVLITSYNATVAQ
jgi:hypothetical protein